MPDNTEQNNELASTDTTKSILLNNENLGKDKKINKSIIISAYRQMLITVVISISFIIMTFLFMFFGAPKSPSITLTVIVCGALGALFSSATRLYNFQDLPATILNKNTIKLSNAYLVVYTLLPILIGAISAVVLYIAFVSGIINGSMFPVMKCKPVGNTCSDFASLISNFGPETAQDYAKSMIWGFIAGFAERLVPDALGRLASKISADPNLQAKDP